MFFAAVRAFEIAEIFHDGQHGNVHHLCHVAGFFHNHAYQFLGGCDDNDAVYRHGLENGEGNVSGSRGHVNQQKIHVAVNHIGPELLDSSGNNGAPPYHGVGFILQQQVDGHDFDTHAGLHGEHTPVCHKSLPVKAEGFGDGRSRYVCVQNRYLFARAPQRHGQQGSDHGFAYAAFAADNAYDFFNMTFFMGRLFERGRILPFTAAGAAVSTIVITICHLIILS